jgi:chromosome segregation ATPase
MALLIELIKNPQNWASVGFLALFFMMLIDAKKEFQSVKEHTKTTNEKLKEHGEAMTNLTSQVLLLKAEVVKDIEKLMVFISKVERNLEKIDHNIGLKTERYEKASESISQLRDNIEDLYGKVTALDITTTEAKGVLAMNKNQLENMNTVLKSFNIDIDQLKRGKK